jgi:NTE family protein
MINGRGAEWRNEFQIGDKPRVFTEFYQPLDYSMNYFIAPSLQYVEKNVNSFDSNGNLATQYRVASAEAGLDVGRSFENWGEFRLGVRRSHGSVKVRVGDPSIASYNFDSGGLFSSFAYNTLDSLYFPRQGASSGIEMQLPRKEMSSDFNAKILSTGWLKAYTWGENTFIPTISVRTVLDSEVPLQDAFPLGGFLSLSGYQEDELAGQHIGLARLIAFRRIAGTRLPAFNMPVYLGASLESGNAWNSKGDINYHSIIYAGSVFLGADTYLGPMYLGYGQAEGGHRAVYLTIGQTF